MLVAELDRLLDRLELARHVARPGDDRHQQDQEAADGGASAYDDDP